PPRRGSREPRPDRPLVERAHGCLVRTSCGACLRRRACSPRERRVKNLRIRVTVYMFSRPGVRILDGMPALGIDLGPMHVRVATLDGVTPALLPAADAGVSPAVVGFDGDRAFAGRPAASRAEIQPEHVLFGVKWFLGREGDDPDLFALPHDLRLRLRTDA